jgi:hypothetical protein
MVTDPSQTGHGRYKWLQSGYKVVTKWLQSGHIIIVGNLRRCRHCSNGYILVTNWRHQFERVHIRGNVVATILSNRAYLIVCPQDRKEANTTLFLSHEILLAHVIAAKHRCCCSSEDAYVAKIDFMYFNPGHCRGLQYTGN